MDDKIYTNYDIGTKRGLCNDRVFYAYREGSFIHWWPNIMPLVRNISGERFGYLTAIEISGKYRRESVWLCKCDCGKETHVKISNLKNRNTMSCGCKQYG